MGVRSIFDQSDHSKTVDEILASSSRVAEEEQRELLARSNTHLRVALSSIMTALSSGVVNKRVVEDLPLNSMLHNELGDFFKRVASGEYGDLDPEILAQFHEVQLLEAAVANGELDGSDVLIDAAERIRKFAEENSQRPPASLFD
jgi:hypothetical protein